MTHLGYVGLEKIGLIPIRDENRAGSGCPNADPWMRHSQDLVLIIRISNTSSKIGLEPY